MPTDFDGMRREYRHVSLDESAVDPDPVRQFESWLREAADAGIELPNAMVLATADAEGRPNARYVLLKGFDARGFVFYSHSVSTKGRELAQNPRSALVFYWPPLHRQVRIEGNVELLPGEEAAEYFHSRPYPSRLSALVAPQSSAIEGRDFMEQRCREFDEKYGGGHVPCPESWAGYRVRPERMEFWQGRENRLHDRILYTGAAGRGWEIHRLAP